MAEINTEKMAKELFKTVMDDFVYRGKRMREWIDILARGDVAEVVRCKDCRAYLPPTESRDWGICRRHTTPMRDDNFCNYGERKEE